MQGGRGDSTLGHGSGTVESRRLVAVGPRLVVHGEAGLQLALVDQIWIMPPHRVRTCHCMPQTGSLDGRCRVTQACKRTRSTHDR